MCSKFVFRLVVGRLCMFVCMCVDLVCTCVDCVCSRRDSLSLCKCKPFIVRSAFVVLCGVWKLKTLSSEYELGNHQWYQNASRHLHPSSTFFSSGTQERVCLITGTVEGITQVHSFIMEKIMEKPDPSAAPPPPAPPGSSSSSASKEGLPYDRHKQVTSALWDKTRSF